LAAACAGFWAAADVANASAMPDAAVIVRQT
jgi:hypothetical protein